MPSNNLPAILVSAEDSQHAKELITELIEKKVSSNDDEQEILVWRLENKYYCVDVRVIPLGDGESTPMNVLNQIEAHIIFISHEENDVISQAEKRLGILSQASAVDICLLLYEGEHVPHTLANWARNHNYEIIALKETRQLDEEDDENNDIDEPFKETYGIERARSVLHAHTWSGLQRIDKQAQCHALDQLALSSDEEWIGDNEEGDEEGIVESAEAFAVAMEAMRTVRDTRPNGADQSDELRRLRAEEVLAAFCRALGTDLNIL